jgi:hypothetical protein
LDQAEMEEYMGDDIFEYQNGLVANKNDDESNDHDQGSHDNVHTLEPNFDSYKIVYDNKNGSGELYMYEKF